MAEVFVLQNEQLSKFINRKTDLSSANGILLWYFTKHVSTVCPCSGGEDMLQFICNICLVGS